MKISKSRFEELVIQNYELEKLWAIFEQNSELTADKKELRLTYPFEQEFFNYFKHCFYGDYLDAIDMLKREEEQKEKYEEEI